MDKPNRRDLPTKKILLVEDDLFTGLNIKEDLIQLGYEVPAVVASGEEAVRKAGELLPDLILMDITLDGPMNGIQAATEILNTHAIPIVYLTAHTDSETLNQAKLTKPFGYLPKPSSKNAIAATIEVALYKSEADAARRKAEDELKRVRDEHEEALRKSEVKYRAVADFAHDWEFWLGPDDDFLYCSPSCQRVTGYSAAAFENDPLLLRALVHPDDLAAFDQHRQDAKDQKEIKQEFEFRIIRANGSIHWTWIAHTCQPVYDDKGQFLGTRASNRDVTYRKRLEAEVAKARNLAALGILAGGIAHDFNNLLQGLLGNLSLAKMCTPETSEAFDYLERAEDAYAQASKLTNQLMAFSTGGINFLTNIQPSPHIREVAASILDGSGLVAEFDLADTLWPINVDPVQFREVIKHMVQNAMDVMPSESGGKLKIMAVNETVEETHGEQQPILVPGNYIRISIEDQGCGISREDLPRIFDPYFSTKERCSQKGMGLGLSLCDTIIKKCGGVITVKSQPGSGTTFHIYIPAVVPAAKKMEVNKDQEVQGPRILLMDDDLGVLQVTTEFLRRSGYRVDTTMEGEAAIATFQEAHAAGDPYALVILDLTIPGGKGGKDVIAILKQIDPEVKAIVSSGYADDHAITDFAEYGFVGACVKPYLLSEMKELVGRFV